MALLYPGTSKPAPAGAAVALDAAPPPAAAAADDDLAALAHEDEPLPVYTRDDLQLLVQSPYRLYAYWQYAHDPFATLRRAFGAAADGYHLIVRLVDAESGATETGAASPARNYWFDVQPGRAYRAEVGFAAEDKPFIRLLTSDLARTPPASVAPETDEAPEFHAGAGELARVVNEAGYAGDALALALEDADDATQHESTLALAHTLAAAPLPALGANELQELRALIVALVVAEPLASVRARLSSPLAAWLDALVAQHGALPRQADLLETLRAMFGFELEVDEDADAAALRPTSFAWSASSVRQSERRVRVWLPSMTPGRGALPSLRPLQPSSAAGSNVWLPGVSTGRHAPLLRWRNI
ncbi:MAG TPA: DUF4912 domain-containing protein [Pyrinomonadaceae bacterium]|nr:DUF4912 domain-containing protein [Pyrinomonadaceae bacterium]